MRELLKYRIRGPTRLSCPIPAGGDLTCLYKATESIPSSNGGTVIQRPKTKGRIAAVKDSFT